METEEILRETRYLAPAHYSLKIERLSLLSKMKKHESGVFEVGGYNWKLIFYPNGNKSNGGGNHISLYLAIVMTASLPVAWEVNVNFKLFVHNQIQDNYLTVQDIANCGVKRFHAMKMTWGIAQLVSLETFKDSSNGYVVNDSCVLGVEVFVIKHSGKGESVSLVKAPIRNSVFSWEMEKFSELDQYVYYSEVFTVGGRSWKLMAYPKGTDENGKFVSLYLTPNEWKSQIPTKAGVHAEYKLRVVDQINGNHFEIEYRYCFSASDGVSHGYGAPSLISLEDLNTRTKGFIVKDSLIVEVEFLAITETTYSGIS